MNQTKDAIEDFNKSIQLSAENAIVYNNRGNALMDLGHPDEAVEDSTARSPCPPAMARPTTTGATRSGTRPIRAAFQDFRKAVELMPTKRRAVQRPRLGS